MGFSGFVKAVSKVSPLKRPRHESSYEATLQILDILAETSRWKARDVKYWAGTSQQIIEIVPLFKREDFKTHPDAAPNPYLDVVIRQPMKSHEREMPVGVVSKTYTLVQHRDLIQMCLDAASATGVLTDQTRCEIGMTELSEWMNFRLLFPEEFNQDPDGHGPLGLRLDCFNSVEGSSRLVVVLGWIRFICGNGMIFGDIKVEFKDTHDYRMRIDEIAGVLENGIQALDTDIKRFKMWVETEFTAQALRVWVDAQLADAWGKKAAARVLHICERGHDAVFPDPFAPGAASEKPVQESDPVPGAAVPARNLFDLSQALAYVAARRNDAEDKISWQATIPKLVEGFRLGL